MRVIGKKLRFQGTRGSAICASGASGTWRTRHAYFSSVRRTRSSAKLLVMGVMYEMSWCCDVVMLLKRDIVVLRIVSYGVV